MSLFDFEELSEVQIQRRELVHHPDDTRSEVVGWIGTWTRGMCYLSSRKKSEHYFRNLRGYAISTKILDSFGSRPTLTTIFIAEYETGTLYEFSTDQFREGTVLDFDGYDKQRLVPVADARRTWNKDQVEIK